MFVFFIIFLFFVGFFSILLIFCSILGMNLFGCKFCERDTMAEGGECDRKNFDSLLWALVTVFQVIKIIISSLFIYLLYIFINIINKQRKKHLKKMKNKHFPTKIFLWFNNSFYYHKRKYASYKYLKENFCFWNFLGFYCIHLIFNFSF